ncbi:unnamed protein product [Parnassius apollo]|uniref:(apollo) hypothetical protein n=1 Tax=Parnassius apollo TaxID=110799 RepID=A0A8S3W024_PARAO|nr:unnamed protein product [Parnassius apollo]
MSIHRTPPKFSSNPNLSASAEVDDIFVNSRKRSQPEGDDITYRIKILEDKLDKFDQNIMETITKSLQLILASELSKITVSLATLNDTVHGLRSDNASFKESLKDINSLLTEMEKSLNYSKTRQDTFDEQLQTLRNQLQPVSDLPCHLKNLESKLAYMEQQARDCNIEIINMPDRSNENLTNTLMGIGAVIKQQILASDIVAVHRVPHADQKDTRPKNVIVKFTTRTLRDNIIAASRSSKDLNTEKLGISGPPQKIFINEHLTLKNKRLFRECRNRAKSHDYKFVWVKHGVILTRKTKNYPVLAIRSEQDLNKIK